MNVRINCDGSQPFPRLNRSKTISSVLHDRLNIEATRSTISFSPLTNEYFPREVQGSTRVWVFEIFIPEMFVAERTMFPKRLCRFFLYIFFFSLLAFLRM